MPLTVEFLKANPFLVLDTRFFSSQFKDRLLASFDDLDEQTAGLLIHSENFQALNLLQARYREQVKCIYIDPPYNTGNDGFVYKDSYQHSSWLSMMENRFESSFNLTSNEGAIFVSIDDDEQARMKGLMDKVFGAENFIANAIWQKKYSPQNDAKWFSDDHDFLTAYARDKLIWRPKRLPRTEEQNRLYNNPDNDPRGPWMSGDYTSNKSATERPNLYYSITNPFTGEEVWPSRNRVWCYTPEQHRQNVIDNRVWWGIKGENRMPRYKRFLSEVSGVVPRTIWPYEEVGHNQEAVRELAELFMDNPFSNPKPTKLIYRVLQVAPGELILDYMAGSGTTGHSVINLNREDGGKRKYILIEMGEYFDSVLKPRIQKVIYSKDWKDGKPVSREGSSHIFKYIRLESYEDTLNNLELRRTEQQASLLDAHPQMREDYMLSYMLDVESRGSASLLNIDHFEDPFNYKLNISTGSVGETRPVNVDLVETFNYLLGLRVKHIDMIRGFRVVEGRNPEGEKVLVIWRNTEKSNDELDEFFQRQGYNTRDMEFDLIYVNGDNNLENLRRADETWKVRLIEEEFQRLMFDVSDV